MAEWLVLPTLDHSVPGLNPTGGGIQLKLTVGASLQRAFHYRPSVVSV